MKELSYKEKLRIIKSWCPSFKIMTDSTELMYFGMFSWRIDTVTVWYNTVLLSNKRLVINEAYSNIQDRIYGLVDE